MEVLAESGIHEISESFLDDGTEPALEPLLTAAEYRAAGLSEVTDRADLDRKYAGGPRDNLMRAVLQPIRQVRVPLTQSDFESLAEISEKYGMDRRDVAQALLRWAISRRREWGGPE